VPKQSVASVTCSRKSNHCPVSLYFSTKYIILTFALPKTILLFIALLRANAYVSSSAIIRRGRRVVIGRAAIAIFGLLAVAWQTAPSQGLSPTVRKGEHRIIFRARNGCVYIPARVNGSQVTLLLDTGAALTTVSLKIVPTIDTEARITINMAKGSVPAYRVPVGFVLGDSDLKEQRYSFRRSVVVGDFNFGEADGVIGLDVLSSFKTVTLDFQNSILILEDL
jgi:hypothetical protein